MKYRITLSALSITLALCVNPSLAAEKQTDAPAQKKASQQSKADAKRQSKTVDINRASKAELKKLPGIADAEAEKIIAGRPYGSKSHLVTRDILPRATYEGLKSRIIVRPPKT